jgi:polyhydroxyalkanoate synthase
MSPPTPPPSNDSSPDPSHNGSAPPRPRLGPRPLALHLAQAAQLTLTSPAGWRNWNAVSKPLKQGALEAAAAASLRNRASGKPPLDPHSGPRPELVAALTRESASLFARFVDSVRAYRAHPYRRTLHDPPGLWARGRARLLDYGGEGAPVLLVPSLVNRATILDLTERRSFARWLAMQNRRVLLLDWGWPGEAERRFDLAAYLREILTPALHAAAGVSVTGRVSLIGYCMGGTLAVPLAERNAALVDKLVLLAAPWDFQAEGKDRALAAAAWFSAQRPLIEAMGILPLDAIETLFASLDPALVLRKFLRFAQLDPASEAAADFVALEDWVGDGVPLAAPAAADAMIGWYGENRPARGAWILDGAAVDPTKVAAPSLVVVPSRDRIVPPAGARPLAKRLPDAHILEAPSGHVSLMVGAAAPETVWKPLISFLNG